MRRIGQGKSRMTSWQQIWYFMVVVGSRQKQFVVENKV